MYEESHTNTLEQHDSFKAEAPGNSLARARMAVAKLSTSLQVEGQLLQS